METEGYCSKKVATQLKKLGFEDVGGTLYEMAIYPTHAHAARWLRDRHRYHVEPTPLPYNRWKVWIVILGKPNLQDGKLNACDLEGDTFETYEEAMEAGLSFALKTLLDAERKAKSLDPRKVREMREELREKGFDV